MNLSAKTQCTWEQNVYFLHMYFPAIYGNEWHAASDSCYGADVVAAVFNVWCRKQTDCSGNANRKRIFYSSSGKYYSILIFLDDNQLVTWLSIRNCSLAPSLQWFTHMYSLLIVKHLRECRSVSVKFPCVYLYLSSVRFFRKFPL